MNVDKSRRRLAGAAQVCLLLGACTVTHKIEPSKEPIVVNLNVNIKQEVLIKMEKDVEDLIANNPDIF